MMSARTPQQVGASTTSRPHPLDILFDRSRALADQVVRGQLPFIEAIDLAYSAAQWAGLTESAGEDLVQAVLALAFMDIPRGDRES
jgi:hypothetical protein